MSAIDGSDQPHARARSPRRPTPAIAASARALANRVKDLIELVGAMACEVPFGKIEQRQRTRPVRELRREQGRGGERLRRAGDLDLEDVAFAEQRTVQERRARDAK